MADSSAVKNLYVHFPFCRAKCTYCSLYSKVGVSESARAEYVRKLANEISSALTPNHQPLTTIYFGGGSPALCDLRPIFEKLRGAEEFTVELHPLDVTKAKLAELKAGGVNRISMGVQSLDDKTLAAMGRGYTVEEALRAFELVRKYFDNAGIDLIVGYPSDESWLGRGDGPKAVRRFSLMTHCSVYSLQNERGLKGVPKDEWVLDRLIEVADELKAMGLGRYEISNYAREGYECKHNLAVWRGEDYLGLGEGAFGRIGLDRTKNGKIYETVSERADQLERKLFRLRTREGLDASGEEAWTRMLDSFVTEGLLTREGAIYRLTDRGTEVCDTILVNLI